MYPQASGGRTSLLIYRLKIPISSDDIQASRSGNHLLIIEKARSTMERILCWCSTTRPDFPSSGAEAFHIFCLYLLTSTQIHL